MPFQIMTLCKPNWRSYLRAIFTIARMDWKRCWRYPLIAVSPLVQWILWLTPMYFMGRAFSVNGEARGFAGYSGTTDYMSFILIGAALSSFIDAVFWGMGYSLKGDMDSGVLETNWLTPMPRPLLLFGISLNSLTLTTISSMGMMLVAGLIFGFRVSGNVLAAVLTCLPMLIGLYGFGFAFASVVLLMREANTLVDMGSFLVTLLSGTTFPVNALPRWLLPISLALPLTYGYDAVRGWLLGTRTLLPISTEIAILIASMGILIWLGLRVFRALERRVRILGTLGQY